MDKFTLRFNVSTLAVGGALVLAGGAAIYGAASLLDKMLDKVRK